MSTTSSFRAEAAALLLLTALGCASGGAVAPDAPLPAIEVRERPAPDAKRGYAPVELTSVRVRRIDADLARFAGPEFMRTARDPVAVEAITATPLPPPLGTASPVLILDGTVYPDTWFFQPNRLVAFVPDRAVLRAESMAEAMWIGAETVTRSRAPVRFRTAIE